MKSQTKPEILSDEALVEIEARERAATKGPWTPYHRISPRGAHKQWHIGNKEGLCQVTMNGHERDYEFMAHAREDVPALCQTVRALWGQLYEEQRRNQTQADSIMELEADVIALREQLAQEILEKSDQVERFNLEWAKRREAKQGNERLQSQLAQAQAENERLALQLKEWQEDKDTKAGYL